LEFRHQEKVTGNATLADHMAQYAKSKGIEVEDLGFNARVPDGLEFLWQMFLELHAARGSSGFGPEPLGYSDILAYGTLLRSIPEPWEVQAIRALDSIWLREWNGRSRKTDSGHSVSAGSGS
jgi:hypothetical protein